MELREQRAVEKVCIWTPDKDLAQCVSTDRVVQVDRRGKSIRDAAAVRAKFGVEPRLIPDYLALVGDAALNSGASVRNVARRLNSSASSRRSASTVGGKFSIGP